MLKSAMSEIAAAASIILFLGCIAIWAQIIPLLVR
jgi:hypothetical protein